MHRTNRNSEMIGTPDSEHHRDRVKIRGIELRLVTLSWLFYLTDGNIVKRQSSG